MAKADLRLIEPDLAEDFKANARERSCSTRLVLRLPNFRANGRATCECAGTVKGLARARRTTRERRTQVLYISKLKKTQGGSTRKKGVLRQDDVVMIPFNHLHAYSSPVWAWYSIFFGICLIIRPVRTSKYFEREAKNLWSMIHGQGPEGAKIALGIHESPSTPIQTRIIASYERIMARPKNREYRYMRHPSSCRIVTVH